MIFRGEIYWADLGSIVNSSPAKMRPVVIIQADAYNQSRLSTVIGAVISSNTGLAAFPGNVFLPAVMTGLTKDSVVNVTGLSTIDRSDLHERIGRVTELQLMAIDAGLRKVLDLSS